MIMFEAGERVGLGPTAFFMQAGGLRPTYGPRVWRIAVPSSSCPGPMCDLGSGRTFYITCIWSMKIAGQGPMYSPLHIEQSLKKLQQAAEHEIGSLAAWSGPG